ncbi:hypothetical protein EMCRGX_G030543 [Ephydatia muelleri]
MEQADTTWQCILKYERDATAQVESILALENFPSSASRDVLRDIILNLQLFYRVRTQAGQSLAKVYVTWLVQAYVTWLVQVYVTWLVQVYVT